MVSLSGGCIVENVEISLNIILKAIEEIRYTATSNLDWINYLTGAGLTIIGFCINNRFRKRDEIRNIIVMLAQNNQKLISLIYKGAYNENKIDFTGIREELDKYNITMILPKDLREEFDNLYTIFNKDIDSYIKDKKKVYSILCNIKQLLDKYGVDVFG